MFEIHMAFLMFLIHSKNSNGGCIIAERPKKEVMGVHRPMNAP